MMKYFKRLNILRILIHWNWKSMGYGFMLKPIFNSLCIKIFTHNNYYIIKMHSVVEFSIGDKPCPLCDGEHQNAICQLP